jgi:predicted NBD/HSP70 family sugar kinase
MTALGVEVTARAARAVVVDADGNLTRATQAEAADGGAAARNVVRELSSGEVTAVGIADHRSAGDDLVPPLETGGVESQVFSPGAAAVVAEAWKGAARNARHAICLFIGDRIFAGVLLDGRPWLGAHGLAGAAAWLALNPVERQDYRKFGSLAAEVSSNGIARRLAWRIQAGDESAVLARAGNVESITAADVYDGARGGDGVAVSVMRDTAKYIAMAIANLAIALDPDVVVLSGPVAAAGDLLLEPVRQECARRLPPPMVPHFRCEISPLGADGVAIGAARLAMLARS